MLNDMSTMRQWRIQNKNRTERKKTSQKKKLVVLVCLRAQSTHRAYTFMWCSRLRFDEKLRVLYAWALYVLTVGKRGKHKWRTHARRTLCQWTSTLCTYLRIPIMMRETIILLFLSLVLRTLRCSAHVFRLFSITIWAGEPMEYKCKCLCCY